MAASAQINDIEKKLNSITECSICNKTFNDPRLWSCCHTYCMECINEGCKDKQPGDTIACQLCFKDFQIPQNGVSDLADLPKNFFMEQLTKGVVDALSGSQKTSPKVDGANSNKGKVVSCPKHKAEVLELICLESRMSMCVLCNSETDGTNDCKDISAVVAEHKKLMARDDERMAGSLAQCRELVEEQKKSKTEFRDKVKKVEKEVSEQAERMKQRIDREKEALIKELYELENERVKLIDKMISDTEQHAASIENLKKETEKLRKKGNKEISKDIIHQMSSLRNKIAELMELDETKKATDNFKSLKASFTAKTWQPSRENYVGKVNIREQRNLEPELTSILDGDGRVHGVTSLDNRLFVLRKPSNGEIEVYDSTTFDQQQPIRVDGLSDGNGLTSSVDKNCLFVCDSHQNVVYKIELPAGNSTLQWKVDEGPTGLSMNAVKNLLVTCYWANNIKEYTTSGSLVRNIILNEPDVFRPLHTIELAKDQLVVSHWGLVHGVKVVNTQGQVATRPKRDLQSANEPFDYPMQLTVCKDGRILVADRGNNRIVELNHSSTRSRDLPLSVSGGMQGPGCLFIDESRDRLYIGEYNGKRVLVFDKISNIFDDCN